MGEKHQQDSVWAEEGGITLRCTTGFNKGMQVRVEIVEDAMGDGSGLRGQVIATATVGRWRWERLVEAMRERSHDK